MNPFDVSELRKDWHGCQRCGLSKLRSGPGIVFGVGPARPRYLLIYDAPTEADVAAKLPMAGEEGDLLVSLLNEAGIEVSEIACTPLVGCRATTVLPATDTEPERTVDRAPSAEEYAACAPRVTELIYRLDPKLIFTMGPAAYLKMVRGPDRETANTVEQAAGRLFRTRIAGRYYEELTYDVIPLLSMQQIYAKPSHAAHGPMATTIKFLTKGKKYVEFVEGGSRRTEAGAEESSGAAQHGGAGP